MKSVVFLDSDPLPAFDDGSGSSAQNPVEGAIVSKLVDSLVRLGILPQDLGVISPYRAQSALLKSALAGHSELEVSTVDTFQGRDKACIIVSFSRSNKER